MTTPTLVEASPGQVEWTATLIESTPKAVLWYVETVQKRPDLTATGWDGNGSHEWILELAEDSPQLEERKHLDPTVLSASLPPDWMVFGHRHGKYSMIIGAYHIECLTTKGEKP